MSLSESEKVFKEESSELLDQMEQILLSFEAELDSDQINSVFRAAHTIKGSSGIFGYTKVVDFTHGVESVLDLIRISELEMSQKLLTLFLDCKDIMARLINEAIFEIEENDESFEKKVTETSLMLASYYEEEPAKDDSEQDNNVTEADESTTSSKSLIWKISLNFGDDVLRNGMDPLSFIHYLSSLGTILNVKSFWDDFPDADNMIAESCYMKIEIEIESQESYDTLMNVFEFIMDDCEIKIGMAAEERDDIERSSNISNIEVTKSTKSNEDSGSQKLNKTSGAESIDETIRVNAFKLGELIDLVGELVISSANIKLLGERTFDSDLIESMGNMSRLVENIRDKGLGLRMVPIGDTFNRYRRVVRDLSKSMNKDIKLEISGADRELDKIIVEKIRDPLMHLVRNALDHGVEHREQRLLLNKPEQATLRLNAFHDSGCIVIEIEDDGAGLSKEKILEKAYEIGLVNPDQKLSESEIFKLIFKPGFTTAAEVTEISGRGVGMDVVMKNIEELRGNIEVESIPNVGSKFSIRLPLTLAIIDGFLVRVGDCCYVIPLDMVEECIEHKEGNDNGGDERFINLRGKVLSFIHLGELFNECYKNSGRKNIVVVKSGNQKYGLVVDDLLGEYQTVIKPLGKIFTNLTGISGATILGDGEVATIIDVPSLINRAVKIIPDQHAGLVQGASSSELAETVTH